MSSSNDRTSKNLPFTQSSSSSQHPTPTKTPFEPTEQVTSNTISAPVLLSPTPELRFPVIRPNDDSMDIDSPMFVSDEESQEEEDKFPRTRNLIPAYASASFRRRQPSNAARRVSDDDLQQDTARPDATHSHVRRTAAQQLNQAATSRHISSADDQSLPRSFSGVDNQPTDLRRLTSLIRPRPSFQTRSRLGNPVNTDRQMHSRSPITATSSPVNARSGVRKKRPVNANNVNLHTPSPRKPTQRSATRKFPGSASALLHSKTTPSHQTKRDAARDDPAMAAMHRTAEAQRRARGAPIDLSSSPAPEAAANDSANKKKDLNSLDSILRVRADSYEKMLRRANFDTRYSEAVREGMRVEAEAEVRRELGAVVSVVDRVVRGEGMGRERGEDGVSEVAKEDGDGKVETVQATSDDVLRAVEEWERKENVRLVVVKKVMCEMVRERVEEGLKEL
ncbi:hypothetical protein H2198_000659 [Neophaeococcomyces mojaviensis]|uniref:Uncharacterized protein n=1 Tax=Neophaeococcomyces mojaviensis TaxID=3383035 RepID=A0ACC3AJP2_9EURO|nr:hypothetical protein H2198_000659 [Knufia sp. JES_112]